MTDETHTADPFPYPEGTVVAGLEDEGAVDAARERLDQTGFGADRCDVLHGEGDVDRIDATGEGHGRKGKLLRRLQSDWTYEGEHAQRYAEYLEDGHYLMTVRVGDDEATKLRAVTALREADAEFLTYYAADYFEDLGTKA